MFDRLIAILLIYFLSIRYLSTDDYTPLSRTHLVHIWSKIFYKRLWVKRLWLEFIHLATMMNEGVKLEIDKLVSEEKQKEILDAIKKVGAEKCKPIKEILPEEIRFVLSDYTLRRWCTQIGMVIQLGRNLPPPKNPLQNPQKRLRFDRSASLEAGFQWIFVV